MAIYSTYHPGGSNPANPALNRAELYDTTAGTYTSFDTTGTQTLQRALTPDEVAGVPALATTQTASSNQATLQSRAQAALAANAAFLALGAPTNLQTLAQVQTLTRECSALIRLALQAFDTTAGT